MKNKFFHFITLSTAAFALAGCVDTEINGISMSQSDSIANLEYLKNYDALKTYVDRSANPDFKLGIALAAQDFIDHKIDYRIACANFDEMTAGNAMKMASCVKDDGSMDFGTVSNFVATAEEAGISIFGHTLAWHSQQPVKWLSSLLKDKEIEVDPDAKNEVEDKVMNYSTVTKFPFFVMGYEPDIINGVLTSNCPGDWHQYFVIDGVSTKENTDYKVTALIRATKEHEINVQFGDWGALGEKKMKIGTEWEEKSVTINSGTNTNCFSVFQPGVFDGTIEIKWVKVTHGEAPAMEIFTDIISGGDAEGGESENIVSTHVGGQNGPCDIVAGAGVNGSNAFVVTSAGGGVNSWDTQVFFYANRALAADDEVFLSFDYRADVPNKSESQAHSTPGGYIHWDGGCAVNFTTEWQHFEKKITINSTLSPTGNMQTFAWNLDVGVPNAPVNKYYFDNVKFQIVTKGNSVPLTPEEKKDTLTWAMDKWIGGMMQACEGKVKSWDVVNEAISGGNPDSEGVFALQHSEGYTPGGTWDVGGDAFYWQDYMGDIDYVRTAVALARKHYEANGGTPSDLKLFVNDYNLESDWDDNGKLKSLIAWIKRWEADGVTKIDGIGTQMHVSCYENANIQKSKEDHIVKMLELMAASGKLCKISELDMGYVDAAGNSLQTAELTLAQHEQMRTFYQFIIKKYFELIPASQRYGITQWCIADAPSESGWRKGEPVGLWTIKYDRKPAYAGFADGLSGK